MKGSKVLNLGTVLALILIVSMASMPTVVAQSTNADKKVDEKLYAQQLDAAVKEIRDIQAKVKSGEMTQQAADNRYSTLLDDPKYDQIKLMKQIVELRHERAFLNNKPTFVPTIEQTATVSTSGAVYNLDGVNSMSANMDGWGVGYNRADVYTSGQYERIAARAEFLGVYYADGYFVRGFTAPTSGNVIVNVYFDWTGQSYNPDVQSIDFVLYKADPILGWQVVTTQRGIVSLSGFNALRGPYNAQSGVSAYLVSGYLYALQLEVHTKASTIGAFSLADFGFDNPLGTPKVHWQSATVSYQ